MQPLTPFKPKPPTPEKMAALRDFAIKNGQPASDVDEGIAEDMAADWFQNDTYVVCRTICQPPVADWPPLVWLSIRRQDRGTAKDWRDFQAIKDQLAGPECEGCELYPARSRVVDTANQYHLWCFSTPEPRFPFGFATGLQTDTIPTESGAVQRPRRETIGEMLGKDGAGR